MSLPETYRRLTSVCGSLRVHVLESGEPAGQLSMADIVDRPEALEVAVAGEAARILATHGRAARPDVAASRLLHHYLWSVGLLISGPWYLAATVPELTLPRLWTDPATSDFTVVPGSCIATADPAAVRASVGRSVRPLLDAFGPRLRRGSHALWGMAADDLVSGVWYLGRMLGEEQRSVRLAEELLPGKDDSGQFGCGADFRTLPGSAGRTYLTRTRTGCCLYYTLRGAEACVTCPRVTDDERLSRLEAATD